MNKGWSVLFGVAMLACFVGFAISPWMGWWMPPAVSSHGDSVDFLFHVILWITAFFFVLTEGILVGFMWLYAGTGGKPPVHEKAEFPGYLKPLTNYLTNQHRVEMAWTVVPAAILLYIAFAQVTTWAKIKYETRKHESEGKEASLHVAVSARQFEWRMRYPSVQTMRKWLNSPKGDAAIKKEMENFAKYPQPDDIKVVNELHIWHDHQVVVHLTTRDVIHSFNLPNFRVKQDALPGKMIPVWFKTKKTANDEPFFNTIFDPAKKRWVDGINPTTKKDDHDYVYDIACAELCGWGHYRMIGRVYVHKDQKDFMDWLEHAEKQDHLRESDR